MGARARRLLPRFHSPDPRRRPRERQARWPRRHPISSRANGYLHIGHAKSIWPQLRPRRRVRRDMQPQIRRHEPHQGGGRVHRVDHRGCPLARLSTSKGACSISSDYFDRMYEWAEDLVRSGKAYVCDLSAEEVREHRGTLTAPGRPSPWRDRPAEENLDLLRRMKSGEFPDGARTLRAKNRHGLPNLNMRDPVLLSNPPRFPSTRREPLCIYPIVRLRPPSRGAIEGITHSICTLEFEAHRPLYDWILETPRSLPAAQIEFGAPQPDLHGR